MKKITFVLLATFGVIFSATIFAANPQPLDKIVVIVNDGVITQNQIDDELITIKHQFKETGTQLPNDEDLKKQILNRLIDKYLLLTVAKRSNILITDQEIDKAVSDIASHNHLSVAQMRAYIEKGGMSFAKYLQQIREQMTITRLEQAGFAGKLAVTDQEVDAFFQEYKNVPQPGSEYHLANILIPLSETPTAADIQKAENQAYKIMQQAQAGKDFKSLAVSSSSDNNALKGGDLGWRKIAELPEIFAKAVSGMSIGQVVGPIRAPNGLHILKLLEVHQSNQKPTHDQVKMLLLQKKAGEAMQDFTRKLRHAAYIKYV